MTVDDLIRQLQGYSKEIREKEIKVEAPNGLMLTPEVKLVLKDRYNVLNHGVDNIDYLLITI